MPSEHYCDLHQSPFYKNIKGDKSWYSHKIANEDKYCNEGNSTANGQPKVEPAILPQAKTEHDRMLVCNALNNATALVNAGTYKDLETAFKDVLKILESA